MHTEDAAGSGSQDASTRGKALNIHTTVRFVKMLHFMLDLLDVITATSKIFRREKLTIPEVPDIIQETMMNLTSLKQNMGKKQQRILRESECC